MRKVLYLYIPTIAKPTTSGVLKLISYGESIFARDKGASDENNHVGGEGQSTISSTNYMQSVSKIIDENKE